MVKNIIIFSDFDGTITNYDVLDTIITNVYSFEKYKEVENKLLSGELTFEKYLFDMFDKIHYDFTNISTDLIDKTFFSFYNWIIKNNIDFFIVSSGFKKIIQYLLPNVHNNIIYANDISIDKNNLWNVHLYDDIKSINKNNIINIHKKKDFKTVFIGDGLSDFKVMGFVNYLFCKKNSLLHFKCLETNCPHIVFENFDDITLYIENNL